MKINIFTYVFWPEQFLVNELAEDMAKQGHEIHVLTGLPNYPKGEFFNGYSFTKGPFKDAHNGVTILRYRMLERKRGFFRLMLNYLSHFLGASLNQFRLPKADWAFVYATSPITTAIAAILWARLNRAKVCLWLQDLWPDSVAAVGATGRDTLFYKLLGAIVRWIYGRTDLILLQSPGFADNLKVFGYEGPSVIVPNWAPDLDFTEVRRPEWLAHLPQKFTVTFAGNVGKAQAVDTVISSAMKLKDHPEIQFAVVGDGSELERIRSTVAKTGMTNMHFYGRRPLDEMPALFQSSDALLVSLKDDPIFARTIPSKVQAYMAAGKPLIGSLNGVGRQVIEEAKAGVCGSAENADELAEAILRLAQLNPGERGRMGANAHGYFLKNYQKDQVIDRILGLLAQAK